MKLHAAILEGPAGQFAVLRVHPERGEMPVSAEARQEISKCFKERHGNIPVAFLSNEPSGLRLLGYEDATEDLQECLRTVEAAPDTQWQDFEVNA
jgi:hypothetical protein